MKLYFKYSYDAVIPDEIFYLKDIVKFVCDYFFNKDINFYITNDPELDLNTSNNIIFLSGSEKTSKLKSDNFILCFSNFFRDCGDERYIALPLGNNKFIENIILNHEPIPFSNRKYDVFFAGFIHPSRIEFKKFIDRLNCSKYIHYTNTNNLQNFEKNLNPDQYLDILKNSKIVVAPSGAYHCSSYRYFEAVYFGNLIFTEKKQGQKIYHDQNFPNEYIIDDWSFLSDEFVSNAIQKVDERDLFKNYSQFFSKFSVVSSIINKILTKIEHRNNI